MQKESSQIAPTVMQNVSFLANKKKKGADKLGKKGKEKGRKSKSLFYRVHTVQRRGEPKGEVGSVGR